VVIRKVHLDLDDGMAPHRSPQRRGGRLLPRGARSSAGTRVAVRISSICRRCRSRRNGVVHLEGVAEAAAKEVLCLLRRRPLVELQAAAARGCGRG